MLLIKKLLTTEFCAGNCSGRDGEQHLHGLHYEGSCLTSPYHNLFKAPFEFSEQVQGSERLRLRAMVVLLVYFLNFSLANVTFTTSGSPSPQIMKVRMEVYQLNVSWLGLLWRILSDFRFGCVLECARGGQHAPRHLWRPKETRYNWYVWFYSCVYAASSTCKLSWSSQEIRPLIVQRYFKTNVVVISATLNIYNDT